MDTYKILNLKNKDTRDVQYAAWQHDGCYGAYLYDAYRGTLVAQITCILCTMKVSCLILFFAYPL